MTYDPEGHHRRSLRLPEYDYAGAGAYFVTVCTNGHDCLLGEIRDGVVDLNGIGEMVREEWARSSEIRKEITLDEFIVMPNHIHGIVIITDHEGTADVRAGSRINLRVGADGVRPCSNMRLGNTGALHAGGACHAKGARHAEGARHAPLRSSKTLGSFVAGFKSAVTRRVNDLRGNPGCPVWQRNYFERVIRNERELAAIREYIVNNPAKWAMDRENPANRGINGQTT